MNKENEEEKDNCIKMHWMLYITPLAFFTGIYNWYNDLKILAFSEWFLVASSIYYWSKCDCQFRRYVDMTIVQISLYIHIAYIYMYSCIIAFALYIFAIISFGLGHYFDSNLAHSFVWIFGCIGNVILTKNISSNISSNISICNLESSSILENIPIPTNIII